MIRDVLVEPAASDRHVRHFGIPLIPMAKL
jgi:hypothetical protein